MGMLDDIYELVTSDRINEEMVALESFMDQLIEFVNDEEMSPEEAAKKAREIQRMGAERVTRQEILKTKKDGPEASGNPAIDQINQQIHQVKLRLLKLQARKASLAKSAGTNESVEEPTWEMVWETADGEILTEAAVRQFKRYGDKLVRKYRCMSGMKAGKLAASASACANRKDPKRVRNGRKVMRAHKNTIIRKSKLSKRKAMSRLVTRMNDRLSGKSSTSNSSSTSSPSTPTTPAKPK